MTTPSPKGKRGRPKAMSDTERRARIISEAEKLFVENGFNGTSTDLIAARCHISKQTLYRLFPSKLDLFAAVVQTHRLRIVDLGDGYDDLPMDQAIAKIFMVELDQQGYELRAAFLRAVHIESVQHPQLREILRNQGGDRTRNELKLWLDRQCENGRLVIDDTCNAAHMLMDMFGGAVVFEAIGGLGWATREERMTHFRVCIDVFLNGALPSA